MSVRLTLLILCLPLITQANPDDKLKFYSGNLASAKQLAGQEGKLYFAEFTASWCAPCRTLEETTFRDSKVIQYIDQYYIPVKVDIDDFDGIALKQVYNVQTIPTVIIFNSKGQLIEKYDKNLPASKMLALLQKHNVPANKITHPSSYKIPSHYANTSYNNQQISPQSTNTTTLISKPSNKISTSHSPMRTTTSISKADKQPVTPSPLHEEATAPILTVAQGNGLYRFRVKQQASAGYSVQIGAFGAYGNVLREVARLQDRFTEPIIVHIIEKADKPIYKIMLGEFASRQEAIEYHATLQANGLEGVIRDMRMLK
jgi:thioredoxin-related protein/cell division septation protein DedD